MKIEKNVTGLTCEDLPSGAYLRSCNDCSKVTDLTPFS